MTIFLSNRPLKGIEKDFCIPMFVVLSPLIFYSNVIIFFLRCVFRVTKRLCFVQRLLSPFSLLCELENLLPQIKRFILIYFFLIWLFLESVLYLFVSRSKTDQLGRGIWLTLRAVTDSILCPVSNVSHYRSIRPQSSGSFLIHENSCPLTVYQFNAVLRKSFILLNLDRLKFTSHSFRIGAATEARMGLSSDLIKKIGRWDSSRFLLYIRPDFIASY